jgi:branched-chain amino acid transport system substrate-binding protein
VNGHLSDEQLISYTHYTLTDAQREAMERHLATCPRCRARLADHEALQRRIHYSLLAELGTVRPSPRMTFAAIAPRLKRSRRFAMLKKQSRQLLSGAAALAALIVLAVGLVLLFQGISSDRGQVGPSPTPSPPPTTLRIALIFPTENLSVGEMALAAQQGALLAIEQRNSAGGVLGLTVEAINFDSKCTAAGGRQAVGEAEEQNLTFFIGGLCASEAVTISEDVAPEKSIFLSLNAHPRVAVDDSGKYKPGVYVMPLSEVLPAQAMAHYARQQLHAQTAATLHDEESSLSTNLAKTFSQVFVEDGGEIVAATSYSGPVQDYTAQLAPIAAASPDVLFLPDYAPQVNIIATQARQMGIEATLLGCDSWSYGLDAQAVGKGYYCAEFTVLDPQVQAFLEDYDTRFGSEADVFAALGYDAIRVLLSAIEEAGTTNVADVQRALLASTFQGLTGPIYFDQVGQAHKHLALIQVEDGEQQFVVYITP